MGIRLNSRLRSSYWSRTYVAVFLVSALVTFSLRIALSDEPPKVPQSGAARVPSEEEIASARIQASELRTRSRDQRISDGRAELGNRRQKDPQQISEGIVSFASTRTLDETISTLTPYQLEILEFFHIEVVAGQEFRGGFPATSDLSEAVSDYKRAHSEMLSTTIQNLTNMLTKIEDGPKRQATANTLQAFQQRLIKFQQVGIQLYGIRVKGSVENLSRLAEAPGVLLVEPVAHDQIVLPLEPEIA